MVRQRPLQPMEAMGGQGRLCANDAGSGRRGRHTQDSDAPFSLIALQSTVRQRMRPIRCPAMVFLETMRGSRRTHCPAAHAGHVREGHGFQPGGEKRGPSDGRGRLIGRMRRGREFDPGDQIPPQRGGMNTKLPAVTDTEGRPIRFFMTAGPPLGDARIACRATGQRLHWRGSPCGPLAICRMAAGPLSWFANKPLPGNGPRLRRRLVQRSIERQRDKAMHPRQEVAQQAREIRQAPVQAPIQPSHACKHALPGDRSRSCSGG